MAVHSRAQRARIVGRCRPRTAHRFHRCVGAVPGGSEVSDPVFREPWEAQAFAITVALHQQGLFSWSEWAGELAAQISAAQSAGDADSGDTYYSHWLAALEKLVATRGASSAAELLRYRQAWSHAAQRTPHGR